MAIARQNKNTPETLFSKLVRRVAFAVLNKESDLTKPDDAGFTPEVEKEIIPYGKKVTESIDDPNGFILYGIRLNLIKSGYQAKRQDSLLLVNPASNSYTHDKSTANTTLLRQTLAWVQSLQPSMGRAAILVPLQQNNHWGLLLIRNKECFFRSINAGNNIDIDCLERIIQENDYSLENILQQDVNGEETVTSDSTVAILCEHYPIIFNQNISCEYSYKDAELSIYAVENFTVRDEQKFIDRVQNEIAKKIQEVKGSVPEKVTLHHSAQVDPEQIKSLEEEKMLPIEENTTTDNGKLQNQAVALDSGTGGEDAVEVVCDATTSLKETAEEEKPAASLTEQKTDIGEVQQGEKKLRETLNLALREMFDSQRSNSWISRLIEKMKTKRSDISGLVGALIGAFIAGAVATIVCMSIPGAEASLPWLLPLSVLVGAGVGRCAGPLVARCFSSESQSDASVPLLELSQVDSADPAKRRNTRDVHRSLGHNQQQISVIVRRVQEPTVQIARQEAAQIVQPQPQNVAVYPAVATRVVPSRQGLSRHQQNC